MPTLPTNPDGSLRAYTTEEVTAMDIKRRGVRQDDHVKYNFGPDGSYCVRKFSCAWDERFKAQIHFVGASAVWLDGSTLKLSRLMPQTDPEYTNWLCTKCEISPFQYTGTIEAPVAGSEPYPEFDRAELTATFELVPYDAMSDADLGTDSELERYVTKPGYPGAETTTETNYISLPGGTVQYVIDGGGSATKPGQVPIPFGFGFVEPGRKFRVIWRRLPKTAWGAGTTLFNRVVGTDSAQGFLGAINETTFLGRWACTLQLVGVEERLLPDPTGLDYSWEIAYVFTDKPVPYGHLGFYYHDTRVAGNVSGYYQVMRPNAAAGGTQEPADIGDDESLFIVREFSELFQVG